MSEDPPPVRCPGCGSVFTSPLGDTGMWECHYHLCCAVFPVCSSRGRYQVPLIAEDKPSYLPEMKGEQIETSMK